MDEKPPAQQKTWAVVKRTHVDYRLRSPSEPHAERYQLPAGTPCCCTRCFVERGRHVAHVTTPTARGLVLIRTLIVDDKSLAAIDKARRTATCGLYRY